MTDEAVISAEDLNKPEPNETTVLPRGGLSTCPMCQGRGVCTKSAAAKFERNTADVTPVNRYQENSPERGGFWLPRLPDFSKDEGRQLFPKNPTRNSLAAEPLPSVAAVAPSPCTRTGTGIPVPHPTFRRLHRSVSTSFQSSHRKYALDKYEQAEDIWPGVDRDASTKPAKPLINLRDLPNELPKAIYRSTSSRKGTFTAPEKSCLDTSSEIAGLLLEESKRPSQPHETLRVALMGLQSSNWEDVVQGLQGVVQVSRWQPALIEPYMPMVNRGLLSLLRGLRSHVTRLACQAAGELFRTMQCTSRPEFDELAGALLVRTADLNRFIRQDANEALDAMVTYLPPQPCVRALLAKGCSHKHPLVRTATARLLTCCSEVVGPGGLLAQCPKRDARKSLLNNAASLLSDPNQETRFYAKKLFESLVQHEDFDSIFKACVDEKVLNQVEKAVALIKYTKHSPS